MNEEIWKPILGYEGKYEISSTGRVKCLIEGNHGQYKPGRIVQSSPHQNHYLFVTLYGPYRARSIHSLVLEAFKGPRPKGQVARHLDRNRSNNTPDNLEWGTSAQNAQDAKNHGTFVIGSKNGHSILDEHAVLRMRELRNQGLTYHELGAIFDTHWSNAWLIVKRKTWAHVQ